MVKKGSEKNSSVRRTVLKELRGSRKALCSCLISKGALILINPEKQSHSAEKPQRGTRSPLLYLCKKSKFLFNMGLEPTYRGLSDLAISPTKNSLLKLEFS